MARAAITPPWLNDVMSAPSEMLGLTMLQGDPHAWRLDSPTQLSAVRDALADGAATATTLRERFAALAPSQIARELGVPIEISDDDPMVGSLWRFAEYRPRPQRILLYRRSLASLEQMLAGALAERMLGPATPQDVFVAHELYHHIEAIRSDPPIARRYRPSLFRVGHWHWRTGIAALAEIAAGAFAQSLLDLPCHPRVLDLTMRDAIALDPIRQ